MDSGRKFPTIRTRRARAVRESWALRATVAREREGWQALKRCAGQGSVFFGATRTDICRARAICEQCPVRMSCLAAIHRLEQGLDANYCYGVFGGLTPSERYRGRVE